MNAATLKKVGRRAAGTWGRPHRTYAKRMSAKAIRREGKKEIVQDGKAA